MTGKTPSRYFEPAMNTKNTTTATETANAEGAAAPSPVQTVTVHRADLLGLHRKITGLIEENKNLRSAALNIVKSKSEVHAKLGDTSLALYEARGALTEAREQLAEAREDHRRNLLYFALCGFCVAGVALSAYWQMNREESAE